MQHRFALTFNILLLHLIISEKHICLVFGVHYNSQKQLTFISRCNLRNCKKIFIAKATGTGNENSKNQISANKVAGVCGVRGVAAGLRHALCVCGDGDVFSWGAGSKGQLGTGTKVNKVWVPVKIDLPKIATGVFCGQYFTIVKLANGEIIGFGDNKHQQLCEDKTMLTVLQPLKLENVTDQDNISCGWTHIVLTREGGVRVRGRDNYHQHGGGAGGVTMTGVRKARAGSEHVLCLSEAAEVWSWGWNEHGNCGLGEVTPDTECVSSPSRLPLDNVTDIFVGSAHCFAITQ